MSEGHFKSNASNLSEVLEEIVAPGRAPRATYRLQMNSRFTFREACKILSYLDELGISDCYISPILKARRGSSHGYDICDHSQLNPELGHEDDFTTLCGELRARKMGLLLDVVPNHMGIGQENSWWMDVLETGPSSEYASYFDIDWCPVKRELQDKVLLPILEDQYGNVLEDGKIRVVFEEGSFFLRYHQAKLPIAPRTYRLILSRVAENLASSLGEGDEHLQELQSILTALTYLPPRTEKTPSKITERHREKAVIKRRLASLVRNSQEVWSALQDIVDLFNGKGDQVERYSELDRLINNQPYRLAFWRVATEEINYRRFFDINELAAIRVELEEVFQASHQLVFRWLAEGKVTGLRVDHPDGLWDPPHYFRRLQEGFLQGQLLNRLGKSEKPLMESVKAEIHNYLSQLLPRQSGRWPLYVVAEKILEEDESLPQGWLVQGTTGYDFLAAVNGLLVDGDALQSFDQIYRTFAEQPMDYHGLVNATKKMIMLVSMAGEINSLGHQLDGLSEKSPRYRDFTLNSLIFALREIIASLPVYRTYVTGSKAPSQRDEQYLQRAVEEARKRNPRTARVVFDFIRETLLLRNLQDFPASERQSVVRFVHRFQQMTGPVMAKGVEDTAFYVYNRLICLNEVGASPGRFGLSVEAFHNINIEHQRSWPHSLLATSTHDTKRSEDVRARIQVLSEMPEQWQQALVRWSRLNDRHKLQVDGQAAPDRNDEYLLYQTLLGAWPFRHAPSQAGEDFRDRIVTYMRKATKEAKVHTSWISPNEAYDAAVEHFVVNLLSESQSQQFLDDLAALQRPISHFGCFNSLTQVFLKLTCPGVPDIYQGSELWDLSLVDPDNRRSVDFGYRRQALSSLKKRVHDAKQDLVPLARSLLESWEDGELKLYLIYQVLNWRQRHPEIFGHGAYIPLEVAGPKSHHVCAFVRSWKQEAVLVVAPRLIAKLTEGKEHPPLGQVWEDSRLLLPQDAQGKAYRNVLTGEVLMLDRQENQASLRLDEIFNSFPVALLERDSPGS